MPDPPGQVCVVLWYCPAAQFTTHAAHAVSLVRLHSRATYWPALHVPVQLAHTRSLDGWHGDTSYVCPSLQL
jgi:hypothetical protein